MSTWLKILPLELSQVTEFVVPTDEVGEGDVVLGDANLDMKKLYTLAQEVRILSEQAKVDRLRARSEQETKEFEGKILEYAYKSRVLFELFYIAVADEYKTWGNSYSYTLKKGFTVVARRDMPGPLSFMQQIFGM